MALVVGIGAYVHAPKLNNPLNDARDMSAALKRTGFEVVEAIDADKRRLDEALRSFANRLTRADVALFFFAGHGLQVGAQNYLVPADARLEKERDLEFETVRLDFVMRQLEIDREGKTSIVILDACRDNPLARNLARSMGTRSASIGRGLAPASTGLGTFIAYSTQPGNVALDGAGRNSPFAEALIRHMPVSGRNLSSTMNEVRRQVVASTSGKQVPWDHSALTTDFFFVPGSGALAAPAVLHAGTAAAGTAAADAALAALQERLKRLEDEARRREAAITAAAPASVPAPPPVKPRTTTPRESPDFEVSDNVALSGEALGEPFRATSPAACREACERTAACVAFQHGRKVPVMGSCQLFSRIGERREDYAWRSGVRTKAAAPAAGAAAAPIPP